MKKVYLQFSLMIIIATLLTGCQTASTSVSTLASITETPLPPTSVPMTDTATPLPPTATSIPATATQTATPITPTPLPPTPTLSPITFDDLYLVDEYDFTRDPFDDLEEALVIAQGTGKLIILEVGGDWCPDCHNLKMFIREHEDIYQALASQYLIVKINLSGQNSNEDFLSQYPDFEWVPHFVILDSEGNIVRPLDTRNLMTAGIFDADKFWAFLGGDI